MPDNIQSIEDLISASKGGLKDNDENVQSKFKTKQQEINTKEMERETERNATSAGVPYIDLFGFPISPESLVLIDKEDSRNTKCVCFFYNGTDIRLGAIDPHSEAVQKIAQELHEQYYSKVVIYIISSHSFKHAFEFYKTIPKVRTMKRGVEVTEDDLNRFSDKFTSFKDLQKEVDKAHITDIVTMIMSASMKSNASDIHIEAEENLIKVRFRVDGVLHDAAEIKKDLWRKIISRLKVLSKVKININDKPQDGRLSINTSKERVDIRVSFLPTNFGESVVMRLLRSSAVGLSFEDLGIRDSAFEQLKKEVGRPNGMIITTGPTGSGKTTTLYAILKKLNSPQTKIITVEDPIEYQLEGINQSQTSEKYTFAQGLKSIVRQDPDIVMVGEIRDLETAEIAIQASLTGHLVLSTIHTNDAAGTVPRFLSMGAKVFLLAPALNAMIGQRLVRRLCDHCKIEENISDEKKEKVKKILKKLPQIELEQIDMDKMRFHVGKGCSKCQGIGYKGRIGIYEILTMDEEIEKLLLAGKISEYDMREIGARKGMVNMVQDGILKALNGVTSLEEIFRVAEDK